jgi:hypothetical protein
MVDSLDSDVPDLGGATEAPGPPLNSGLQFSFETAGRRRRLYEDSHHDPCRLDCDPGIRGRKIAGDG